MPTSSRSLSRRAMSAQGTAGFICGRPAVLRFSSNPPNREFSWLSFEFWKFCPYFDSSSDSDSPRWLSSKKSSRLISGAKQSNAPAMARFSMVRRLMAPLSTRSTKSYIEVNGPPSFLAAIMALTTFPPMPFMAASPNRMSPLRFTPNAENDSFTSGPLTLICIDLHSSMKFVSLVMSFRFRLRTAAIYSAG